MVSASRWISSRDGRLGHSPVQPVAGDLLDLAPDPLDRCERAVATIQVVPPTTSSTRGSADQQQWDQRGSRVVDLLERDSHG